MAPKNAGRTRRYYGERARRVERTGKRVARGPRHRHVALFRGIAAGGDDGADELLSPKLIAMRQQREAGYEKDTMITRRARVCVLDVGEIKTERFDA